LDEILHPTLNRAVTPREAARLQSFPDWYQFAGPYVQFHGAKEQDKYEQIGDAIPPLLACAIGKQFVKCLPKHE
jgi:DNA (cytosine-5)-methyltransferase 1